MAPCALDESFTSFNFVLTKIKPVNNERAGASARGKPRQPLFWVDNSFLLFKKPAREMA